MEKKLVYDIGAHKGDDSYVYLKMGYQVVAVEANPFLVTELNSRFRNEIIKGDFTVVNCAVAEVNNETVEFFINTDSSKSSVRKIKGAVPVPVNGLRLGTIVSRYGKPYYCKIDIEDADIIALKTLDGFLPDYISVEVSGKSLKELQSSPADLFATVNFLHAMGYRKFKLVDQENLHVLSAASYYRRKKTLQGRMETMVEKKLCLSPRDKFRRRFGLPVNSELSGYPSDLLDGVWIDYEEVAKQLAFHFEEFCSICQTSEFIFWVDVHAALEK